MTDLQNMIVMLSGADTEFRKENYIGDWKLTLLDKGNNYMYFLFNEDGSFKYCREII